MNSDEALRALNKYAEGSQQVRLGLSTRTLRALNKDAEGSEQGR